MTDYTLGTCMKIQTGLKKRIKGGIYVGLYHDIYVISIKNGSDVEFRCNIDKREHIAEPEEMINYVEKEYRKYIEEKYFNLVEEITTIDIGGVEHEIVWCD